MLRLICFQLMMVLRVDCSQKECGKFGALVTYTGKLLIANGIFRRYQHEPRKISTPSSPMNHNNETKQVRSPLPTILLNFTIKYCLSH